MKKTKPVKATTAVATDSFEESKEKTLTPSKDTDGNYIGDDGDRLFTRDEVTQILRVRLDRQLKSITERYSFPSATYSGA